MSGKPTPYSVNVSVLDVALREDHVAERLLEISGEPPLVVLGERLQVHLEQLGELQQQGDRERTLVALDQVQVARRDPQALREVGLREPGLLA